MKRFTMKKKLSFQWGIEPWCPARNTRASLSIQPVLNLEMLALQKHPGLGWSK